ncbi:MAG: hypothetical protein ACI31S_05800 [Bacilli bacterium]
MVCAGCKNLDTKKKVNGAVSGVRYYCKKNKVYVGGNNEICDKFANAGRDTNTYNDLYKEGREWDDDKHSASFYLIIGSILLILTLIVYLFNRYLF